MTKCNDSNNSNSYTLKNNNNKIKKEKKGNNFDLKNKARRAANKKCIMYTGFCEKNVKVYHKRVTKVSEQKQHKFSFTFKVKTLQI